MLNNIIKESESIKFIKKNYKFIVVIILYFLYQTSFAFGVLKSFGIDVNKINRNYRISIFALVDIIYIGIILFMFRKEIKDGLEDLKNNFEERSLASLYAWITGSLIMVISSFIISIMLKQKVSSNEALVRESIKLAPLYMLFTCSFVAPIFEEMVFRRSLYGLLKRKWEFIFLSGLAFGLLHVLGSFNNVLDFLYVIPYGAMGFCFAYLYYNTKNITLPIIIHIIHNTVLVLIQIIGG